MNDQNTFAIAELQQKANEGDAQAQFDLAYCYAKGIGKKGNMIALFDHAYKHIEVEKNLELAFMWLTKSAEQGLVNAQLSLGVYYSDCYLISNDKHTMKKIGENIDKGRSGFSEFAPFALVSYFFAPFADADADAELGFKWFKTAAEQDCAEAQYWLACCYYDGIGIEQNDELAFEWLKKASEQDCVQAQLELAGYYLEGRFVKQSYRRALEWYEKAAKRNNDEAINWLNEQSVKFVNIDFDDEKFTQDDVLVFWRTRAAEQGVAEAQYRLAKYYLYGDGVEKDYSIGMNWLIKAVQANHVEANRWLENTYLNFVFPYFSEREEVDQCHEFAFEWLLSGHEQNPEDFEINFGLAVLYAFGKGVENNQELAIKHFIACRGECDVHGREVAENFTEIFYYFSDLFNDISAGTVKSNYFDDLAPFFLIENPVAMDTKKSYAVLPSLRIAFHLQMGEFELLKEFLNSFENLESSFNYPSFKKNFKNMGLTANKQAEDIVQKTRS